MKYTIKPNNKIKCESRNGIYKGNYIIKNDDISLTAKDPRHLEVMMKFRHKIGDEIKKCLNKCVHETK